MLSHAQHFATPLDTAHQAPLVMGLSREEYWGGQPFPSPGDLPDPGTEPGSPALQADSLPSEPPGKPPGGDIALSDSDDIMKHSSHIFHFLASVFESNSFSLWVKNRYFPLSFALQNIVGIIKLIYNICIHTNMCVCASVYNMCIMELYIMYFTCICLCIYTYAC